MKNKILFCFTFCLLSICVTSLSAQYCMTGGPSSSFDSNVQSASLIGDGGTQINYTGCPGLAGVQDLTGAQTVTVTVNSPYTANIQFGTCGGNYGGAGEAWVDWNQNNTFDPTESIGTWSGTPPTAMTSMPFIVPATAIPGSTRMRVMQRESGTNPLDPCGSFTWGSVVDFTVVVVGGAPITCPFPSNLFSSGVVATSATLNWTENGTATSWEIEWGPSGFTPGTGTSVVTATNPHNLTGISPITSYDFYVRAICGPADSSYWVGSSSFTTTCGAAIAPWTDNIEAHPTSTNLTTTQCWTATAPTGYDWNVTGTGTTSSSNTGALVAHSGTKYFYTEASGAAVGAEAMLTSPLIDINGLTVPMLQFYYHMTGSQMGTLYVEAYNGSVWSTVDSIVGEQQTAQSDLWLKRTVYLVGYTGLIQARFKAKSNGSFEGDICLDDIAFLEAPTCPEPTGFIANNVSSVSADLLWTDNAGATNWEIEWGPSGFAIGTGTSFFTATNPYTLTGLTSNTAYDVYVRAVCGPADSSLWSSPASFQTLCSPVTNFPFWEGFNSTSTTQDCWTVLNQNADFDQWDMDYSFNAFEGDECVAINTDFNNGLNNDYLISPRLMLTGAERLHFKHRCNSTFEPNDFEIRLSTTGIAATDFTNLLLRDTSTAVTYQEDSVDLFAFSGPCHIAFRIPPGGLDGWRLYIDDVLIERLTYNDAGVASLVNPVLPTAGGFTPLDVEVANYGVIALNTFTVEWEVDGIAQPPVAYTGLPLGINESTTVNLANLNLPPSTTNLKFWTTMPNGVVDEDFENDTLSIDLCPGLAGIYTVGHPSSDFPTANDALEALTSCGVSAPVTMEFQPGTYIGQWEITKIPGANAMNTVTFDGLNSADAILQHTGFGVNGAATLVLNNVEYFVMKNFTIRSTGINQAYGVLLTNNANHNTIEDNIIVVPSSGSLTNVVAVLASASYTSSTGALTEGNNSNWNLIKNNDISGGISAVIFEGGETNTENTGNQIVGNRIHNSQSFGIYADEQDSFVVSGNVLYDIVSTTSDAMMLFDIHNYTITGNDVTSKDYGIAIWGSFGDACTNGLIANNMVDCPGTGEALYLRDAATINIYHNTLRAGRACWLDNQGNIDLRNNILTTENGHCFYTLDPVSMAGMDHNLYYISGAAGSAVRFGTIIYNTFIDWQTNGPGLYDANSVSGDPGFVAGLHVAGLLAIDTGDVALTVPVLTDIDGEARPMGTRPDIGADEHLIISDDAMVVGLVSPGPDCGSTSTDVIVEIANLGFNQLISTPVTVNLSGAGTATYNTTVPLIAAGATAQVNMGTLNTEAGGTYVFQIIINSGADLNPDNDTMTVSLDIAPSNQMGITTSGDTLVCVGSRANLMAAASYAPATILWYDAPTGGNLLNVGTSYTTGPLAASTTYYLEVQGCNSPRKMATVNADIVGINVDLGPDVTACGGGTAVLTSTVTLSTQTSIVWSNGSHANFIHATAAGDYIATVANANGCVDSDTINVTLSTIPTVTNTVSNVTCGGTADGSIDITATGSTYSYLWNNGAVTEDLNGLSGGFYSVTVTDNATASNCEYDYTFQVLESGGMTANVDAVGVACSGNDGFINISVLGGLPTYTFLWSNGDTLEDATGLAPGTYTVTVTDTVGCDLTATGTITAATPVTITVDTIFDEIMAVQGGINVTATGGSGTLVYSWNTGATTANVTGLVAGTYSVTVTDLATGCQSIMDNIVVVYKIPDFVNNITALNAFKLYPNPTQNRVWVNLALAQTTSVQLDILTVTGQVIHSYTPREDLEQNYEIDMSQFPSGVYLARFVIGSEVMTTKIVVE